MKDLIKIVLITMVVIACSPEKKGNMMVQGNIDGLKKGTIYLQKVVDTVIVAVDSVVLNGSSDFVLYDELESPELYYIQLDDYTDKIIAFFGEKDTITIASKLDKFSYSAKITGSENHLKLEEHNEMIRQFNGRQLEVIKERFDAQEANDTEKLEALEKEEKSLERRKFFYTVNYAVQNGDMEIAPYLALTELRFANIQILDTVNNALSSNIKKSKYGKELADFISHIKSTEERK